MATQCYVPFLLVIVCSSLVAATPCYGVLLVGTFKEDAPSGCNASRRVINGINLDILRSIDRVEFDAPDPGLMSVTCCQWDAVYDKSEPVIFKADWKDLLKRQNQWVRCPPGFFLEGLYGTGKKNSNLEQIAGGRCVKPSSHPYSYEKCKDETFTSFGDSDQGRCEDDFFVTGLFRGSCKEPNCLDKVRCCQMSSQQIQMESLEAVKIRIMEETLEDISYLAHYLGYDNAGGCRSGMVGEDFLRYGDTWEAVKGDKCVDYKGDHVFSIEYRDWKFNVKDMVHSEPITDNLNPETIDLATIYNKDDISSSHIIRRKEQSVTTVTHSKTSQWSASHEAGTEGSITVNGVFVSSSLKLHYKFNYASGETQQVSELNEQSKTFEVESSKVIPPNRAVKWYLVLFKTRTTLSYTATVLAHFSVGLRGRLRSGDYYGNSTNYNYNYRGHFSLSSGHNYTFGGSHEPFYTSLKKESKRNSMPWMWSDMQANYNYRPEDVINNLINEDQYAFTLTGTFEAVSGSNVNITWEDVLTVNETKNSFASGKNETDDNNCWVCGLLGIDKKRDVGRSKRESVVDNDSVSSGDTKNRDITYRDERTLVNFARTLAEDPPPVFPPPPPVNITRTPKIKREPLAILGN